MNAALAARLAIETDVLLFDVFGVQNSFTANAASLGLVNVTDACGAVRELRSFDLPLLGRHPPDLGRSRSAGASDARADGRSIIAVPEPETYALLLVGLAAVGGYSRRKKQLTLAA